MDPRERFQRQYAVEKELAGRLRNATRAERPRLYAVLYDEFFRRVPDQVQVTRKLSPEEMRASTEVQIMALRPFLRPDSVFLEIGPGDCALSLEVAKTVKQVYAVDVSDEITKGLSAPANFSLVLADGSSVPGPKAGVDLAYSTDLIEHLHPEDALEHLLSVRETLAPRGAYLCVTPNRICGPHDVSGYFDEVATGLHLREYSAGELADLFRRAGFSRIAFRLMVRGRGASLPVPLVAACESLLSLLPRKARMAVMRRLPFRLLFYVRLLARP